ncbi:uncharacterized protein LOC116265743 isoform X2 [Nymphaea colorata]|uniref:uncharacterized protein LOC116265743 isoform X2 n=1 Tax=Nymphaea colorata TaxID=210225 RepID=UPI00129D7BF6|nr:uncharacterized protein LOC116265743 isoform X2 [Nymphaea colorata]
MFAKRLLQKTGPQQNIQHGSLTVPDLNIRIILHHGIPLTSSILAYDPIQGLLAIGTLDGRIKLVGGDGIECLLVSPVKLPFKSLEFLHNMGYLVSVSNENDIQVWNLEHRCVAYYMQWESNVTSFSVIQGSSFMYVGDEAGVVSVLKYDAEEEEIVKTPYNVPITSMAGITLPTTPTVVGILPQPTSANRVLIAYESGLIILWDTREDNNVFIRNSTDIQLKDGEGSNSSIVVGDNDLSSETHQEEKEICSLCWASADGSILAVGYIDGDILLWNISSLSTRKRQQHVSSADVAKLQLSSAERRLPVIVLHWRACGNVNRNHGGQLFIYGGDEIGSEEVLTVLSLEWSSGLDSLRCISRTDLKLHGSFADMILLPALGSVDKRNGASLFVLTNPGQLHTYDDSSLSMLSSLKEGAPTICGEPFPGLIPLIDPSISVAKIFSLPKGGKLSEVFAKVAQTRKTEQASLLQKSVRKWPLTGGVPSPLSFDGTFRVERVYILGYQDGSVRVWDATLPSLSLIFVIGGEMPDVKISDTTAPVSALDLCCTSGTLAIGNQSGLIRVYNLLGSSGGNSCHFVSETTTEVHIMKSEKDYQCVALFSLLKSPIRVLQLLCSGGQLAIGCEDGQVLMLNAHSFTVMFHRDHVGSSNAAVVSMEMKCLYPISSAVNNSDPTSKPLEQDMAEGLNYLFLADRDAHIIALNAATGDMISSRPLHPKNKSTAISMHILVQGKSSKQSPGEDIVTDGEHHIPVADDGASCAPKSTLDSLLLLCCEKALRVYSLESVLEGESKWIHKVDLEKPCCWSATFMKDENTIGVVLLYQTGLLEIRSFPGLELIAGSSLLSILRWNLNANMAKTICSDDNGHIALNNSSELAFISILSGENDFRIPDSLACLHDKVLAVAADAAMNMASYQDPSPGIIGNIMKGFKGGPVRNTVDNNKDLSRATFVEELGHIFSKNPFHDSSKRAMCQQDDVELSIDDIEIDDIVPISSSSTASSTLGSTSKQNRTDEEFEREKLLGGKAAAEKPRMRRPEEIIAQYRKAGDASGAAKQARDKLVERQEKLERLDRRTAELESGAQNFKSMADELVKTLEGRKWWQI